MLCERLTDPRRLTDRRYIAEPKLDGQRAQLHIQHSLTKREPTHVQIANRAFEIYVSRGAEPGHDIDDWFEAERQLRTELQPKRRSVKRT